jgi:long-subunit fatty acid transport protein
VRLHPTFRALAAVVLLGAVPCAAQGDWTLGAEAGLRHDDNVGNAQSRSEIVADSSIRARLAVFQLFPIDGNYSVSVGCDVAGESFHRLTGLNNATLECEAALKKKWALGAFAPWSRAAVSVGKSSYDDSYRNAWIYRATLAAGRRIDERWNLWADYAYERRAARAQMEEVPGLSGDAFSQDGHTLEFNVEYSLRGSVFLGLGLVGRRGDVVSTTAPGPGIFYASRALAEDPAFGPEEYAYRLLATTFGFRVGIHFSPTAHSLLGLTFTRLDTRATGDNSYDKSMPEITWDYDF